MKKQIILIFFMLLFVLKALQAQTPAGDTTAISLIEVLKWGGANNLTIKEYEQKEKLAEANLAQSREWWVPEVYAGFNLHYLKGTAMNTDGRFFQDVTQKNSSSGLGLSATWNFGNGIWNVKAQKLRVEAGKFLTRAERNNVLLKAIDAYYDFLAVRLFYQAYQSIDAQSDTIVQQMKLQVNSGLAYQSDLLITQSNLSHIRIQRLQAKTKLSRQEAELVNLLNLPGNTKLISTDSVLVPLQLTLRVNGDNADSAFIKRPEYQLYENKIAAWKQEKKTVTTGLLIPQLYVNTNGAYFGGTFTPYDPTALVNAGLSWHIPLGQLLYGGETSQYNSHIALAQNKLDQFKNQVSEEMRKARSAMQNARQQMNLAKESLSFAGEALRQSMQRQELGTIRPYELLESQRVYISARLDYLKAVADYNKAQYHLFVASGNNL